MQNGRIQHLVWQAAAQAAGGRQGTESSGMVQAQENPAGEAGEKQVAKPQMKPYIRTIRERSRNQAETSRNAWQVKRR